MVVFALFSTQASMGSRKADCLYLKSHRILFLGKSLTYIVEYAIILKRKNIDRAGNPPPPQAPLIDMPIPRTF